MERECSQAPLQQAGALLDALVDQVMTEQKEFYDTATQNCKSAKFTSQTKSSTLHRLQGSLHRLDCVIPLLYDDIPEWKCGACGDDQDVQNFGDKAVDIYGRHKDDAVLENKCAPGTGPHCSKAAFPERCSRLRAKGWRAVQKG